MKSNAQQAHLEGNTEVHLKGKAALNNEQFEWQTKKFWLVSGMAQWSYSIGWVHPQDPQVKKKEDKGEEQKRKKKWKG